MGIEPILVTALFLVLLLWAFVRAVRTGCRWAWIGFGLAAGLGVYALSAGRLLPVLAALLGVIALVRAAGPEHPERRSSTPGATWNGRAESKGGPPPSRSKPPSPGSSGSRSCLCFAPLGIGFIRHPDQLLLRNGGCYRARRGDRGGSSPGGPLRNFMRRSACSASRRRRLTQQRVEPAGPRRADEHPFMLGVVWPGLAAGD